MTAMLAQTGTSLAGETHFWRDMQDGGNVSYCFTSSVTAYIKDNMTSAMNYAGSSLSAIPNVTYHSNCDVSVSDGNPRTDVAWFDAWRDGIYGEVYCKYQWPNDGSSNQGECDQVHAVLVGETIAQDAQNNEEGYAEVACHELGHALGFAGDYDRDHPPGGMGLLDCMIQGNLNEGAGWNKKYSSHHISDFNSYYD
ncbi:hypothetical protein ACLQ2R_31010 [Streptosporangium sp. DT93]|uniref:hypothetical protein n=1 Tax=Streptosporangium sp. DT93 TaxID=3393428 RepID=UPI003CE87C6C